MASWICPCQVFVPEMKREWWLPMGVIRAIRNRARGLTLRRLYELVLEVRPVARVRIVDAQVNDHDVPGEIHRLPELFLLEIRPVSVTQERRARLAEVPDLVTVAEHFLQSDRIAFPLPVIQPHPVCNAVSHAGDLNLGLHLGLPARIGRNKNERQREGAGEQITPCH